MTTAKPLGFTSYKISKKKFYCNDFSLEVSFIMAIVAVDHFTD